MLPPVIQTSLCCILSGEAEGTASFCIAPSTVALQSRGGVCRAAGRVIPRKLNCCGTSGTDRAGKETASHRKFASRYHPVTSVFPSGMLPWVEHIHARQTKHLYLFLPVIPGNLCSARRCPRSPMQKVEFPASAELKNYTQLPQTG